MLREGGVKLDELFERVRLRVNATTKGAAVPWNASNIEVPIVILERGADAPPATASDDKTPSITNEAIADLGPKEAYIAAVNRDTIEAYQEFITAFPEDPLAKRARALLAARREAVTWRKTRAGDTAAAYWSYLKRYPKGPHAGDCRRRLGYLSAELDPPPAFDPIEYDVPPPPEEEIAFVDQPEIVFDDPAYDFVPPPPPPLYWLPPQPVYIVELPPPPPPIAIFVLPVPVFVPIPVYVHAPLYVARPPRNVYFENMHDEVVFNNVSNTVIIKDRGGRTRTFASRRDDMRKDDRSFALAPSLPPSVAGGGKGFDDRRKKMGGFEVPIDPGKAGRRSNSETAIIGPEDRQKRGGKRNKFDKRSGGSLIDALQSPDGISLDRQRLNSMKSQARRKLKANMDQGRGRDLQDAILDEGSRASRRIERLNRKQESVGREFRDRRRRSYDGPAQSLAEEEQGQSMGLENSGGRKGRGGWRKAQQRDFRAGQDQAGQDQAGQDVMGRANAGQQDDRRNRKRSRGNGNGGCGASDQPPCN